MLLFFVGNSDTTVGELKKHVAVRKRANHDLLAVAFAYRGLRGCGLSPTKSVSSSAACVVFWRVVSVQIADQLVRDLELYMNHVSQERQDHEFAALAVGLSYFDREGKGAITAAECPELSARLFNLLDYNKDGAITHDDLMKSVNAIINELDKAVERISKLLRETGAVRETSSIGPAAESISVQLAENEAMIDERKQEVQEKQKDLKAIFSTQCSSHTPHTYYVVDCC